MPACLVLAGRNGWKGPISGMPRLMAFMGLNGLMTALLLPVVMPWVIG